MNELKAIQGRELFQDFFWNEFDFGRALEPNNGCFRFFGGWASEGMDFGLEWFGQVNLG